MLEQHVGVAARPGRDTAESFFDSVGIGAYRIDLHPSTSRTRDTVDIDSFPFEIPLGALLPVRIDNLLPACKNLGTTRVTSGAYRVHPVEWSIGEAAGTLAAFALTSSPAAARRARRPRQARRAADAAGRQRRSDPLAGAWRAHAADASGLPATAIRVSHGNDRSKGGRHEKT